MRPMAQTPTLFDDDDYIMVQHSIVEPLRRVYLHPPHFRSGHSTQAEAARKAQRGQSETCRKILDFIAGQPNGACNHEIVAALGIPLPTVCGRCNDLQRAGLVCDSGVRRKTAAGVNAKAWKAVQP